ncbi:MAG: carboxypeptidase regulatory-like domain-containing protein [Candidatus Sumerlaeia bacterium]|nr:carboxypeptidase regulatory-like domain-containing protein [Candidatus Sumerlaeia bacterium]
MRQRRLQNSRMGKADWVVAVGIFGAAVVLIVLLLATRSAPTPEPRQITDKPSVTMETSEVQPPARQDVAPRVEQTMPAPPASLTEDSSGTIFGEIRSSVLAAPLSDAQISLWKFQVTAGTTSPPAPQDRSVLAEVTTNSEGKYSLDYDASVPDGTEVILGLTVSAPGHAGLAGSIFPHGLRDRMEINATLDEGQSLARRVILADGSGVPGVEVHNRVSQRQGTITTFSHGQINLQPASQGTTDDQGRFVLEGAHLNDAHATSLHHEGSMYGKQFPKDADFLEIVLPIGDASIHVTVRDHKGHPMVGMMVSTVGRELFGDEFEGLRLSGKTMETNTHGISRFEDLPAGNYTISALPTPGRNLNLGTTGSKQIELGVGEQKEIVLQLEEPHTISGRVLDDETERPIPGAEISIIPMMPFNNPHTQPSGYNPSTVYSDGNGEFTITGQMSPGFMANMIFVRPPEGYILNQTGHRMHGLPSVAFEPEEDSRIVKDVEVRLIRGEIIRGTVVWDDSGEPVGSVVVNAEAGRYLGMNPMAYTGQEGDFSLTVRKNTDYTIRSEDAEGYGEIRLASGDEQDRDNLEIRLKKGGTVRGTVVNEDGDPVPEAVVMWSRRSGPAGNPQHRRTSRNDGTFELTGVGPGTIHLMVNAPEDSEYAVAESKTIDIESGRIYGDLRIVLPYAEAINGMVVDDRGEPIEGARVIWFISTGNQMRNSSNAATDEEGRFTINGVTPDTIITQINASHDDYTSAYHQRYSPLDGDLKLVLRRRGSQSIQAVEAGSGRPIPKYEYLIYESAWDEYSAWMNASVRVENPEGKAELRSLNPGGKRVVVVELDSNGESTGRKGSALFSADREGGEPVKVEVHRPFEVEGTVVSGSDDDPVEEAKVFVVTEYPWQRQMGMRQAPQHHEGFKFDPVLTDTRGRFTLTGFTHGTFMIAAEPDGAASRVIETIVIEPGVPVPSVTLRMESMARISGTITDCDGEPIRGVSLRLLGRANVVGTEAQSDGEGRFEFGGLPEGPITIQVNAPGHTGAMLESMEIERGADITHDIQVCQDITLSGTLYVDGQPGFSDPSSSIMLFRRDHSHFSVPIITDGSGHFSVPMSPGVWDIYLAAAQHSLYIPFDSLELDEEEKSVEHDIHLELASCDVVFEFPEDFPRSQGHIQVLPSDRTDLPRRGGAFMIQENDERRHLPTVPQGEYVVRYDSFNGLLSGESEPTVIARGELNVIFIEIEIADGERARIAEAQSLLRRAGFDAGPIDGLMGPMTAGAIRAFENANQMTVTGEVSNALLEALRQD